VGDQRGERHHDRGPAVAAPAERRPGRGRRRRRRAERRSALADTTLTSISPAAPHQLVDERASSRSRHQKRPGLPTRIRVALRRRAYASNSSTGSCPSAGPSRRRGSRPGAGRSGRLAVRRGKRLLPRRVDPDDGLTRRAAAPPCGSRRGRSAWRRARADADDQALGHRPGRVAGLGSTPRPASGIDPLRGRAQRQLAQRDQVPLAKNSSSARPAVSGR